MGNKGDEIMGNPLIWEKRDCLSRKKKNKTFARFLDVDKQRFNPSREERKKVRREIER